MTRMGKLDEIELRRPGFVPGSSVTLADGQAWQLRKPIVRFVPDDSSESGFTPCLTLASDDAFHDLMKERESLFTEAGEAPILKLAGVELRIGKALLLANYDLTPDQIKSILQFGYDADEDPEGFSIRESVLSVAEGRGPKPSPGGNESSPTPPGN